MSERTRLPHAHRESGFWEPDCRHHPLGCPSVLDRLLTALGWAFALGVTFWLGWRIAEVAFR